MKSIVILVVLSVATSVFAQRSPYAGLRPSGGAFTRDTPPDSGNRVGLDDTQNQNVPFQVQNDIGHYNYLQSLPQEQQPFWLINRNQVQNHLNQPQNGAFGSPYARRSHFAGIAR